MNIDDFMNQAESYNQDSDTLTGFFGLDDDAVTEKAKSVIKTAMTEEKKSDIILAIDAITESKIEAIVLTFFAVSKLEELSASSEMAMKTAPMVAMALSMCQHEGLFDEDNMEEIAEVFSKVFSML
jgi:hypothetical protein